MALFTTIGTALGATAATAFTVGATATVAAAAAGTTIFSAYQQSRAAKEMKASSEAAAKRAGMPAVPLPAIKPTAEGTAQVAATQKKKAMARSKSVRTSPLGIAGEAEVARKTLLGQ